MKQFLSCWWEKRICLWSSNKLLRELERSVWPQRDRRRPVPPGVKGHLRNHRRHLQQRPQELRRLRKTMMYQSLWNRHLRRLQDSSKMNYVDTASSKRRSSLWRKDSMCWRWRRMPPTLSWSGEHCAPSLVKKTPQLICPGGNATSGMLEMIGSKMHTLLRMVMARRRCTSRTGLPAMTSGMMDGTTAMRPTGMATMRIGMKMMAPLRCHSPWTRWPLWMEFLKIYAASSMKRMPFLKKQTKPLRRPKQRWRKFGPREGTMIQLPPVAKGCHRVQKEVEDHVSSVASRTIILRDVLIGFPAPLRHPKEKDMESPKERAPLARKARASLLGRKENSRARAKARASTTTWTMSTLVMPTTTSSASRTLTCMSSRWRTRRWVGVLPKRHSWIQVRLKTLLESHQCRGWLTQASSSTRLRWEIAQPSGSAMDWVWRLLREWIWWHLHWVSWRSMYWMGLVNRPRYFLEPEIYMRGEQISTMTPSSCAGVTTSTETGVVIWFVSTVDISLLSSPRSPRGTTVHDHLHLCMVLRKMMTAVAVVMTMEKEEIMVDARSYEDVLSPMMNRRSRSSIHYDLHIVKVNLLRSRHTLHLRQSMDLWRKRRRRMMRCLVSRKRIPLLQKNWRIWWACVVSMLLKKIAQSNQPQTLLPSLRFLLPSVMWNLCQHQRLPPLHSSFMMSVKMINM